MFFMSVPLWMYLLVNRFYLITESEDIIWCGGFLNYTVSQLLSLLISIICLQCCRYNTYLGSLFLFSFCLLFPLDFWTLIFIVGRYCVGRPQEFSLTTPFMCINTIALPAQNWASGKTSAKLEMCRSTQQLKNGEGGLMEFWNGLIYFRSWFWDI